MNERTTKQTKFDVAEYTDKVRSALKRLKDTQRPGVETGTGTKTDVLNASKAEIKALLGEGYTAKQVADAISKDAFGILPKSITQLIGAKPAAKRVKTAQSNKTTPTSAAGAQLSGPGTFQIKNDTTDL